ncbi:MAG: ABC transporter ATP-binding protein, partial [Eubacteriales bacterium]|nr:ABC transporter ATP-binding protein [Eubacteriales bacterium]
MSRSRKAFRAQQAELADLNGYIEEMTQGQKVVKVFNYENRAIESFDSKNEELRQASTDAQSYSVSIFPIMGNLSFVQYAITAMVGAIRIIGGYTDIGTLATFLQYTRSFSRPLTQISNQINVLIAALAGAERVFALMDQPAEIDEGEVHLVRVVASEDEETDISETTPDRGIKGYVPKRYLPGVEAGLRDLVWCVPGADGACNYVPVCGDIRFDDVTFSYVEGEPVLKNISLYAKPGQRIAFVGSTGAGKTTITNLINRFYDVQEGTIYYDGIDVKDIRKDDLRMTLGMVLQEVHLFTDTVADNIRYGDLHATDEEVVAAAKFANADFFIRHLPEGYDTMLHDNGSNLSQGQRQLISIARAAVADPLILILDEATSSVDTRTERLIEKGMDNMMEGRTTFAIAHRLSTVRHSNAIMVLEDGEIMERGDHDQLMEMKGRYYDLNMGTVELE